MLDLLCRETVTVRRPKAGTRQADATVEYEAVVDEAGEALRVRCRIERRGRRILSTQGGEIQSDATMLSLRKSSIDLGIGDVVVDRNGDAWRIERLESAKALFGNSAYVRADLVETALEIPPDDPEEGTP